MCLVVNHNVHVINNISDVTGLLFDKSFFISLLFLQNNDPVSYDLIS